MKRLYRFFSRKLDSFWLVLQTFMLLGCIRIGLCLFPFSVLRHLLDSISRFLVKPQRESLEVDIKSTNDAIYKLVWAVNVSSKYSPGKVKCLARALATKFSMNRRGYFPELRIGIAPGKTGNLEAHAWVENRGKVLIGQLQDLARYKVLPLPSSKVMVES